MNTTAHPQQPQQTVRSNTGPAFIFLAALLILITAVSCMVGYGILFPHQTQAAAATAAPTDTPTPTNTPNMIEIAGTLAAGTQMANYATQTLQAANGSPTAVPPTATFTPSAVPPTTTATDTPAPVNTLAPTTGAISTTAATQAVATDPTQSAQPGNAPAIAAYNQPCLTDGQMQDVFGFTAQGIKPVNTSVKSEGENCKWNLQAVGVYVFKGVLFPADWEITATLPDQSVRVFYGDNERHDIMGATFRQRSGYAPNHWVNDPDRLLAHEFNFGWSQGRDPHYLTINGNLTTSSWNNYDGSYCPTNTVQVAGLVGGEPSYWTTPTWTGGAWVFKVPRDANNQPNAFLLLTAAQAKGATSWIDYWNSSKNAADKLENWASLALSDASWHCDVP